MKKIFAFAALLLLSAIGAPAQDMGLTTNLADYANYGTLNAEASCALARRWTLSAGVKYNPFTFGEGDDIVQNKRQAYSLGLRFWPWHVFSGWWLSAKTQWQEYSRGGIDSSETTEGDRFGGGLAGGYAYMLGKHFNASFGVGVWGGYDIYRKFSCPVCGLTVDSGEKFFVLPDELIVALTYVF